MKLYTALGRYTMKETASGEKIPHVIIGDTTYELDLWEMIVWSSLIWNICTYDEICQEFYKKEREAHILGDLSCDDYLKHMEQKGLITVGEGVTGIDALHNLISGLYVIPVTANLFTKTAAFLHLTFIKGVPLHVTKHIFDKESRSTTEKKIVSLAKQTQLTVGELIKCVECGVNDVSTDEKLVDQLYNDDTTTYKNIGTLFRTCDSCHPVLEAVSTLYLNKNLIFEKCV